MRAIYIGIVTALCAAACSVAGDMAGSTSEASNAGDSGCPSSGGMPGSMDGGGSSSSSSSSGSMPTATAPGFFHTAAGKIVDSKGNTVRLTGLSWFGLETATFAPHGLWSRGMGDMLDQIKSLGFNVLRVPYSNALFASGSTPNGIDFSKNPDLMGLNGAQILDKLVAGAKARGLRIFLDRHRPDAGSQSPLWYTGSVSEAQWISDWTMLAQKYKGDPTVIGADLHNEPHDTASWGTGDMATDWRLAAERAGNAIQDVNPDWLIIVEGVEKVGSSSYWWGGNLGAAAANPVRLKVANRVVYSPHDYPASVYSQSWFSAPGYPSNLPGVWDPTWGSLAKSGTAPVLVGEFGTRFATPVDQQWLQSLVKYIQDNGLSFTFWCWNPDSGDTGGILNDDWTTVRTDVYDAIKPALAPML